MTHHELPPEKHQKLVKAIRLEWVSILYLLSAIVALYFTLGNSQAMKAAWAEDILSLLGGVQRDDAGRDRVGDLMDKEPTVVDHSRPDPLRLWVAHELRVMDWVKDAEVRLREEGHVFFGEAFVVPVDDEDLIELVITPVREIHRPEPAEDDR